AGRVPSPAHRRNDRARTGCARGLSRRARTLSRTLSGGPDRRRSRPTEREKHMKTIKGPAIFLAQFAGDTAPFNSFDSICEWAASLGYKGVQVPSWDGRLFDLVKASESKDYCDEIAGIAAKHGLAITELSTHLQGQLVAVHPAYDEAFDGFAPPSLRGNPGARQEWAVDQ